TGLSSRGQRDGVGHHQLVQHGLLDVLDRTTGQYRVRAVGVDLGSAAVFQGLGRVAQGAGGVDHVVYQDAGASFDVADDVHHFGVIGLFTALVDDTQVDAQGLGDGTCAHDTTDVRGDDHQVLETLVFDVVDQYG